MVDEELHGRLMREHCAEFGGCIVGGAFIFGYWFWPHVLSLMTKGYTIICVGRGASCTPITLNWAESPFAVVGLMSSLSVMLALMVWLSASPAYHLIRLGMPSLDLPRKPGWRRGPARHHLALFGGLLCSSAGVMVALALLAQAIWH